jgi:hypothetical protein
VFLQLRCCEGTKKFLSLKRSPPEELLYLRDRNHPEIYRTRPESNNKMNLVYGPDLSGSRPEKPGVDF